MFLATAVLAAALTGCSNDDAGAVDVTLDDFSIAPSSSSVTAGTITFSVRNDAGQLHEFVVARTDLADDELPTGDDGDVAEEGADDLSVADEIEDIEAGTTQQLVVDLDAGHYVLFCNLPGHYRQGMHTDFTVS